MAFCIHLDYSNGIPNLSSIYCIDVLPVHGPMSMGKGIPMKKGCVIGMYLIYISVIFKFCLHVKHLFLS